MDVGVAKRVSSLISRHSSGKRKLLRTGLIGVIAIAAGSILGCSNGLPDISSQVLMYAEVQECAPIDMSINNQALLGTPISNNTSNDYEFVSLTATTGANLEVERIFMFEDGASLFAIWPFPISLAPQEEVQKTFDGRSETISGQKLPAHSTRSFGILVKVLEEGNVEESYLDNVAVVLRDSSGKEYVSNYIESRRYVRTGDEVALQQTLPEDHICLPS